jgi:membrane-bound lytic murein transglycosylase A
MPDGRVMRIGYAGQNGHPYVSVGQELVRQGIYPQHRVSAATIRDYVRANPDAGAELLRRNPSYVFFREVRGVPPEKGPIGAMGRSVTAGRTIAVDPRRVTLGAPVWIEKRGRAPINRLMVAQDTGGAIRGAQRADIFYGTGDEAGRLAGIVKDPGRMVVLMPIDRAFSLATGQPL